MERTKTVRRLRHALLLSLLATACTGPHGWLPYDDSLTPPLKGPGEFLTPWGHIPHEPLGRCGARCRDKDTGATHRRWVWPNDWFPPIGDQCDTESCVGWAVGYAARSFYAKRTYEQGREWHPLTQLDDVFSPSWVYNAINGGQDQPTSVQAAMCLLRACGAARWPLMPFTCEPDDLPTVPAKKDAAHHLWIPRQVYWCSEPETWDLEAMKKSLCCNGPLVFMMLAEPSFTTLCGADFARTEGGESGAATHAIVCAGYDDDRLIRRPSGQILRGAFLLRNSWGVCWGRRGKAWVSYDDMRYLLLEAWAFARPGPYWLYDEDCPKSCEVQTRPGDPPPSSPPWSANLDDCDEDPRKTRCDCTRPEPTEVVTLVLTLDAILEFLSPWIPVVPSFSKAQATLDATTALQGGALVPLGPRVREAPTKVAGGIRYRWSFRVAAMPVAPVEVTVSVVRTSTPDPGERPVWRKRTYRLLPH